MIPLFDILRRQLSQVQLPRVALLLMAEKSLNRLLKMDPVACEQFAALQDKVLRLHCIEPDVCLLVFFKSEGVRLMFEQTEERENSAQEAFVNCSVSATGSALFRLAFSSEDQQQVMHEENVIVSGEAGLLMTLSKIIRQIEPDFEGWLAQYTGGMLAHGFTHMARSAGEQASYAVRATGTALKEWLREESDWVPAPERVRHFGHNVRAFCLQLDRLEARIERLDKGFNR